MLTFPYPLDFLSGVLKLSNITRTLLRFDEESGSADGRFWSAEMAKPLWEVSVNLRACRPEHAEMVNSRIRALRGSQKSFLWADPTYKLDLDPSNTATVSAVSADRSALNIVGLPPYYVLRAGHVFSAVGTNGRYWFTEVAEDVMAGASGVVNNLSVYPFVPYAIALGTALELRNPTMEMRIPKDGFTPYARDVGNIYTGASIRMVQKV